MSSPKAAGGPVESLESFEAIEQAVMETPRGRWFLAEYARRQRGREMSSIVESMKRLERAMGPWLQQPDESVAARISRAIDAAGEAGTPSTPPAEHPLEARQLRYFSKDEELFAPAPATRPVAVPDAAPQAVQAVAPQVPTPAPETQSQPKRRIIIIRHKAGEPIDIPLQDQVPPRG